MIKAWIIKIGAFLFGILCFWKWIETATKLRRAIRDKNNAIKNSRDFEDINSEPYVDNPADFLCYEDDELPDISEDNEKACDETEYTC